MNTNRRLCGLVAAPVSFARKPVLLIVGCLVWLASTAPAQYTYTTNNGAITITGYACGSGAVTIPSTIDGYPVSGIGASAFAGCDTITSVTIPTGVTMIASAAFYHCSGLTNITISSSVTNIGGNVFESCQRLTAITVDPLNPSYSSLRGVVFNKSQTTLVQCPAGQGGSYTIPDGVTLINYGAFSECSSLTNLLIPTSVTGIGSFAFNGCTSLTNLIIPSRVTTIGGAVFRYCFSLTSIAIPASVTVIGGGAFASCRGLVSITVDNLNPAYSSADGVLFNKNKSFLLQCPAGKGGDYVIPSCVTLIEGEAFRDNLHLTSVLVPNSVTYMAGLAFASCTSLTNLILGSGVTNLFNYTFSGSSNLATIQFLGDAPTLTSNALYGLGAVTMRYPAGATGWTGTWNGFPTAVWTPPSATITVAATPTGKAAATGAGTYPVGINVQLTATAPSGWVFANWSDGSTANPYRLTVPPGGGTYTANFRWCAIADNVKIPQETYQEKVACDSTNACGAYPTGTFTIHAVLFSGAGLTATSLTPATPVAIRIGYWTYHGITGTLADAPKYKAHSTSASLPLNYVTRAGQTNAAGKAMFVFGKKNTILTITAKAGATSDGDGLQSFIDADRFAVDVAPGKPTPTNGTVAALITVGDVSELFTNIVLTGTIAAKNFHAKDGQTYPLDTIKFKGGSR